SDLKAHFASVLGEYNLFDAKEKILGVVWDGTGLGEDNAIWGGEFFSYENYGMNRLTHFEYVDWIAADKMAKEPRLSLLSMLPDSEREIARPKFSETEWKVYNMMLENNRLKTSSVGRLFDAVASLLNIIDKASYEGEAAMFLENLARNHKEDEFIDFLKDETYKTIPSKNLLKQVYTAIKEGVPITQIANGFIYTLALIILNVAKQGDYRTIACSGGVFQNAVLVEKLLQLTRNKGIELKINCILSSNDENISFGQLCYYQHIKN
ncbi:MAG: carbamoyltransferase HypF, partial [Bacteroidota bacterium]